MKKIPLTKGLFAIVDDDYYEELSGFSWQACPKKFKFYAVRMLPRNGIKKRTRRTMHSEIYGPIPKGFQIDHINGNSLDNRRDNLRIATQSQQNQNSMVRRTNLAGVKGVSRNYNSGRNHRLIRIEQEYASTGNRKHWDILKPRVKLMLRMPNLPLKILASSHEHE